MGKNFVEIYTPFPDCWWWHVIADL